MAAQAPNIRTCQIIAAALMMGVIMFGGIILTMHLGKTVPVEVAEEERGAQDKGASEETIPSLFFVAFLFTGGALVGRFVMMGVFDRQLVQEFDSDREPPLETADCLGKYQTRTIISLALLEGPAFFALITFMVEGRWEAFGLAVFLLLFMAINFPTETKFNHWVETARLNSSHTIGD